MSGGGDGSGLQIWKRELSGGAVAVALHNGADTPMAPPPLDLAAVGFAAVDRVHARDLFKGKDLGAFSGVVHSVGETAIPAHGVIMLRLELQRTKEFNSG